MTEADVIAHWRKGAKDALESAKLLCEGNQFTNALFLCHLAVEKALKALYMAQYDKDAPYSHNLLDLALSLQQTWSKEQKSALDELTDFVVGARYSDPVWAREYADKAHASQWIDWTQKFLFLLDL
jgi:HEPN domain-containing protein